VGGAVTAVLQLAHGRAVSHSTRAGRRSSASIAALLPVAESAAHQPRPGARTLTSPSTATVNTTEVPDRSCPAGRRPEPSLAHSENSNSRPRLSSGAMATESGASPG